MKKRQGFKNWILLVLFFGLSLFVFSAGSRVQAATSDGRLVLDPNVITNSTGGIGTTSDFPIRNRLFTDETNQKLAAQEKSQTPVTEPLKTLSFSRKASETMYAEQMGPIKEKLFVTYEPQVFSASVSESKNSEPFWAAVIVIAAIPLTVLAVFLGRGRARRKMRRAGRKK
ncbi:type VII secretion protein EssA [Lactovum odontotermitis]